MLKKVLKKHNSEKIKLIEKRVIGEKKKRKRKKMGKMLGKNYEPKKYLEHVIHDVIK